MVLRWRLLLSASSMQLPKDRSLYVRIKMIAETETVIQREMERERGGGGREG